MKTLVYVHGTNGSGKSTLARAVLAAAGGLEAYVPTHSGKQGKAGFSATPRGVALLGAYVRACGGVDGFSPYAHIHPVLDALQWDSDKCVFAEGLITPGIETCQRLAARFDRAHFVVLNTPVEQCIANVMSRRGRKANDKEYNPANLYKKHASAQHWGVRLAKAELTTHQLEYPQAYRLILELLGLPYPSTKELLK